jgi:hypothetical protein
VASGTGDVLDFFAGRDPGSAALRTLYRALLLITCARLPEPELSASYLFLNDDHLHEKRGPAVFRRIGPCERELIVLGFHQRRLTLTESTITEITRVQTMLATAGDTVNSVVEAIVRTTRPGFTDLNEVLHLVAGLEALLVAHGEPMSASFSRRYSVLAATGDPREFEALGRLLYYVRSDLIHGRPVHAKRAEERVCLLEFPFRELTCLMAIRALQWFFHRPNEPPSTFHRALDSAFKSHSAFAEF